MRGGEMASAYCTIRRGPLEYKACSSSVLDIIRIHSMYSSESRVESVERQRVAQARRVQRSGPGIRVAAAALTLARAAREAADARVVRRVRRGRQGGASVEDGDAQQLVVRARREATWERRGADADADADADAERVRLHRVALAHRRRTHVARAARRRHEVWLWLVGRQPVVRVRQVSLHHQLGRVARQLERTKIELSEFIKCPKRFRNASENKWVIK